MTGTSATRSDEECARIASAALKELSETRALRPDESAGGLAFLSGADSGRYRFAVGAWTAELPVSGERLILVGWGDVPLPFALVPRPEVTYFDVRFGVHSRQLGAVAAELKACLERNGCVFKTFSPTPRPRGPLRSLRDRFRR